MNMNTLNYDNYLTSAFEKAENEAHMIEEARGLIVDELIDAGDNQDDAVRVVGNMSNNDIRSWIIDKQ